MQTLPNSIDPESLVAQHGQDAQRLRGMLLAMAERGAVFTQLILAEAQANADAGMLVELAGAYDRVSRSVRQTAMLVQKLTAPAPAPQAAPDRVAPRKEIIRRVEDAIHRGAPPARAESLRAELLERMERPECDDDVATLPLATIIADLCADLGVSGPDSLRVWPRRTPEDSAALHARAAASCQPRARGPGPIRGP